MKQFMKYSLLLLLCSAVCAPRLHAVTKVVPNTDGGASSGETFQKVAQAAAFHRPSGTMVFGLGKQASEDALGFASNTVTANSAGSHAMLDTVPTYTGIAESSTAAGLMAIRNSSIQAVAVANDITSPENFSKAKIFFLSSQGNNDSLATSNVGHPLMVITTTGIPSNPNALKLTDANSTAACCYTMTVVAGNAYGTTNNKTYAFVAVKDDAGHDANRGNFGYHAGDGVVMVECGEDDYTMTQRAKAPSSVVSSDLSQTYSLNFGSALDTNVQLGENGRAPAMYYSQTLKRLYVGVNYTTSNVEYDHTGGWGVQIFQVDPDNNTLTNLDQSGDTEAGGSLVLTGSHIVGVGGGGSSTAGTRASLTYHNLKVMHTSTGPSDGTRFAYLIVNGGNGHGGSTAIAGSSAVSNRVWATPLVVGNATAANNGKFADVTTGDYSTVATNAGDLFLTNTAAVRVGNGPLPCAATTKPSAMWVDGDAVYCSIDAAASNTDSPGIWHSQACFNRHGQIDHWTEWQRVAPANLGYSATNANNGRISFFAVDAISSRIWGVDTTKKLLRLTSWASDSKDANTTAPAQDSTGLIYNLNSSSHLAGNCTAICDLNSSTTGWGATTPTRLTMFGNDAGKVSFAITGSAVGSSGTSVAHSAGKLLSTNTGVVHNIAFDYSTTGTLKTTTVAAGKVVCCLAYSGWNERASSTNTGYFFAGVEDVNNPGNGELYVWAAANLGAGFDTRDVHDLNMPPFRTTGDVAAANARTWQKLTRISGVPSKIVSRGGAVYILTHGYDEATPDRIFRLTRQSTAAALNTDFCVTASSGKQGSIAGSAQGSTLPARIYDFVITVTTSDAQTSGAQARTGQIGEQEQLMMLTNDGIWTTTCSIGTNDYNVGSNPDNAQGICGWVQMSEPNTDNTYQLTFDEPAYTRNPSTFWFNRIAEHKERSGVYFAVDIHQMSRRPLTEGRGDALNNGTTWGNWAYNPTVFNAFDGTATEPTLFDQEPPIMGFYSDGSRRIVQKFRVVSDGNTANLYGQPYASHAKWWNNLSPHAHLVYNPGSTSEASYLHGISNAGSTGKLLIATDSGVRGLV